jgi:hypothetical protein
VLREWVSVAAGLREASRTSLIPDGDDRGVVLILFGWCSPFALRPITPGTHCDRAAHGRSSRTARRLAAGVSQRTGRSCRRQTDRPTAAYVSAAMIDALRCRHLMSPT